MGPSRLLALLAPVLVWARRLLHQPAPADRRHARRLAVDSAWGPPVGHPRPWMPGFFERSRAAGLIVCGAVLAGVVLAGLLGFAVWLLAVGIHHVASS